MSDSKIGFSPQPNQIPLFCFLSRKSTSLDHRRITQTPSLVSSIDDYEGETLGNILLSWICIVKMI